jgi:hypothetical protein
VLLWRVQQRCKYRVDLFGQTEVASLSSHFRIVCVLCTLTHQQRSQRFLYRFLFYLLLFISCAFYSFSFSS